LTDFLQTLLKCSFPIVNVQCTRHCCASSRSRSPLKVKCQTFLCPLNKSYTIFFEFGSNVDLSKIIWRTYSTALLAQGQGHTWRSNVRQCHVQSIFPISLEGFSTNLTHLFRLSTWCADSMSLLCQLRVTLEGQMSNNFGSAPSSLYLLKGFYKLWLKCSA
jgi:hypothetical protein